MFMRLLHLELRVRLANKDLIILLGIGSFHSRCL